MHRNQYHIRLFIFLRDHFAISISLVLAAALLFAASASTYAQASPDAQLPDARLVTGSMAGTIANTAGAPVAGMVVIAYRSDNPSANRPEWRAYKSTLSGAAGEYELALLQTGIYRLGVRDPNQIYLPHYYGSKESLADATDIPVNGDVTTDLAIVIGKAGKISGTVTNLTDMPLPDAPVTLYRRTVTEWVTIDRSTTDEAGRYMFEHLRPGDYTLYFAPCNSRDYDCSQYMDDTLDSAYINEFYDDAETLTDAAAIAIAYDSDIQDVDAQLDRHGSMSGSVEIPEEITNASLAIGIYSAADNYQEEIYRYLYEAYENEGIIEYTFPTLKPGTYIAKATVIEWDDSYYWYDDDEEVVYYSEFFDNTLNPNEATAITVNGGADTPNIDFVLDSQTAKTDVSGTVRSNSGEPLAGMEVKLLEVCPEVSYEDNYDYYYYYYAGFDCEQYSTAAGQTVTDAEGKYSFSDIEPGSYQIRVSDPQIVDILYLDPTQRTYIEQIVTRRLDLDENTVDITMEKGGTLIGSALTWDERTPYDATINLYKEEGLFWEKVGSVRIFSDYTAEDWAEDCCSAQNDRYPNGTYLTAIYPPGTPLSPLNGFGFSFAGLPEGNYRLGITESYYDAPELFYEDAAEITNATTISVTQGILIEGITLTVGEDTATASIDGYVTVDGAPQANSLVELFKLQPNSNGYRLLVFTNANDQGYYAFEGLEAGDYKVRYSAPTDSQIAIYYGGAYSLEEARTIQLGLNAGAMNVSLGSIDTVVGTQSAEQQLIFAPISMR